MTLSEQLEMLWLPEREPPDLVVWLAGRDLTGSAAELLAALKLDQHYRWRSLEPWYVEDYLLRLVGLPSGVDWRVELAVGEYEARRDSDRPLSAAELSSRFPELSETLREKLGVLSGDADVQGTQSWEPEDLGDSAGYVRAPGIPIERRGRYELRELRGEGSFGQVYLGYDTVLRRRVAVKVPKPGQIRSLADAEQYLREARMAAKLEHPHIVPVHDCGRTDDVSIYIVSQYIPGKTLKQHLKEGGFSIRESAELVAGVAEGLAHAHGRGLIHRDIKPANILLDSESGRAMVTDFGLAIRADDDVHLHEFAGTPGYMSPEQLRSEGHRLDGRSDVYSLGVVLYQLLTGVRPFRGSVTRDLVEDVLTRDPDLPRSLRAEIPIELERICLRALAKRLSDRYQTAAAFAGDLRAWLESKASGVSGSFSAVIRPRGIRAFEAADAEFFPELLPGPRDRDGLPESIGFWKQRIEESDGARTFSVGLIYGASGCGKSSLVKAGLLPRLSPGIVTVLLDATSGDSEGRLKDALCRRFPDLPSNGSLAQLMTTIRRNPGPKVAIFLDQFEQWLNGNSVDSGGELVRALRQCDGRRLQAVLMVRDDFTAAAAEFMDALDVRMVQGENHQRVELFDRRHAAAVLVRIGRAFGRLPESAALTVEQQQFVDGVVEELQEHDRIVPIRLALLADMLRYRPWESGTLETIGGAAGVGKAFLRQSFDEPGATPRRRELGVICEGILKALLPPVHRKIKGATKSVAELREATGCIEREDLFAEGLRILDQELRLITPGGGEAGESTGEVSSASWQLTHDFLVPSVREWLAEKQAATEGGRAMAVLEERALIWVAKQREVQQLPGPLEWVRIVRHTDRVRWSAEQRELMRVTGRRYVLRFLVLVLGLSVMIGGMWFLSERGAATARRSAAAARVAGLGEARTVEVAGTLAALEPLRAEALSELQRQFPEAVPGSDRQLHLAAGMLQLGEVVSPEQLSVFERAVRECRAEQISPLVTLLRPAAEQLLPALRVCVLNGSAAHGERLRAACFLAHWELMSERGSMWSAESTAAFVAGELARENPVVVGAWQEVLRPAAGVLVRPLRQIFEDSAAGTTARVVAAALLADYAGDDLRLLTELLLAADPQTDRLIFPALEAERERSIELLEGTLEEQVAAERTELPPDPRWKAPAIAVRAKLESGHGLLEERFAWCADLELSAVLELSEELRACGYRPTRIRPHGAAAAGAVRAGAVWVRDGGEWKIETGLMAEELPQPGSDLRADGLVIEDAALVADAGELSGWLTLWAEPAEAGERRCCVSGMDEATLEQGVQPWLSSGYTSQLGVYVWKNDRGERRFAGIYSSIGTRTGVRGTWSGENRLEGPQRDLSLAGSETAVAENPQQFLLRELQAIQQKPPEQLTAIDGYVRGVLLLRTGNAAGAVQDFEVAKAAFGKNSPVVLPFQALALARSGNHDAARDAWLRLHRPSTPQVLLDGLAIQLAACRGELAELQGLLDAAVTKYSDRRDQLLEISKSAAAAATALRGQVEDAAVDALIERAMECLSRATDDGAMKPRQLLGEVDFADLHEDPRFGAVVQRLRERQRYAGVWHSQRELETQVLRSGSAAELAVAVRAGIEQLWRPVSVAADVSGGSAEFAVLLARPLVAEAKREQLAKRQAAAAGALLRLRGAGRVWPLLEDSRSPQVRTHLIHRLPEYGVDPELLMQQLANEQNPGRRRALIQLLGELAAAGRLHARQREAAIGVLAERCAEDADPGVHSMSAWSLRQLGAEAEVTAIREAYATGQPVGGRRWYYTRPIRNAKVPQVAGFAVIDATGEFRMGSSVGERGRGNDEILHRRRPGRWVAIGMHEITGAAYQAFRKEYPLRTVARTPDSPAESIPCYDAAAFCNWLSELEGIGREQWAYDPDEGFGNGMRLKANYLELEGYRLATEAEWEFAARGGTETSRFTGDSDAHLELYAWFAKNSDGLRMLPVGSLRPNPFGLFDVYGNVAEWTQDDAQEYDVSREVTADYEQSGTSAVLNNMTYRKMRGGSLLEREQMIRSAYRAMRRPDEQVYGVGFRVVRTMGDVGVEK